MNILSIESSCDETAVAIVRDGREILTDCIASQVELHKLYGGVVPEIASRKHIEAIYGLADQALVQSGLTRRDLDAIAVTYAPGLIGAVLVGVNFAKAAAYALDLPLVPVHHIRGHIAANYLAYPELEPPFICLVVSGGHTLIVDVRGYTDFRILGTTRDDAAGECFDKVARVLGMPYPGGAAWTGAQRQAMKKNTRCRTRSFREIRWTCRSRVSKRQRSTSFTCTSRRGKASMCRLFARRFPRRSARCWCRARCRRSKKAATKNLPLPAASLQIPASARILRRHANRSAQRSIRRRFLCAATTAR